MFLAILFAFLQGLQTTALASDFQSPRSAGLGGAGHAAPLLNDSIYLNPSYSAFMQAYSVGLSYQNYYGTASGNQGGRQYNLSVQDGRSPLFQAGLGYTVRESGAMVHLGASRRLINQIAVGLGTKFIIPNAGERGAQELSLSATAVPFPHVVVSIQVENLLQTNSSLERRLQREFVLGTKFTVQNILAVYLDPHFTPIMSSDPWGYEFGAEFTMLKDFALRAGLFRNAMVGFVGSRTNGFAAGAGWVGPRLAIDYSFTRSLGSVESADAFTHAFGATMYF